MSTDLEPITYPARPINGGPLDKMAPKVDTGWYYEPKFNGWRTLIHLPTGTLFNRKGGRVAWMEWDKAIQEARRVVSSPSIEWLDCEAIGRRLACKNRGVMPTNQGIHRGTLVVLDIPKVIGAEHLTYVERVKLMKALDIPTLHFPVKGCERGSDDRKLFLTPRLCGEQYAGRMWDRMQEYNKETGFDYYEGFVAKHGESEYPIQLESPSQCTSYWQKHRWEY